MPRPKIRLRAAALWFVVAALVAVPLAFAAFSPLLAYRDAPYIAAGIAGVAVLAGLLVQPLLGLGTLPHLSISHARRAHRVLGQFIALGVALHVGGLYLTNPPDTVDALLLVSPTPFSVWGVLAMAGVIIAIALAGMRKRLGLRRWRAVHYNVTSLIVFGSVIHALLISGTMEYWSKLALCIAVLATTGIGMIYPRVLRPLINRSTS